MPRKSTAARTKRQILPATSKVCGHCRIEKAVADFFPRKNRPGNYSYHCKVCSSRLANARTKAKRDAERSSYPDVPPGMVGENTSIIDAGGYDWSWAFPKFRPIPNYPGYGAGENGSVWTRYVPGPGSKFGRWKRLIPFPAKSGQLLVSLYINGVATSKTTYSLVMITFVGPCPDDLEVCHYNGSYADNWLCNLRYDTHTANEADKVRHGTRPRGERVYAAKLNPEKVKAIRRRHRDGESPSQLTKEFGICYATFRSITKLKTWAWVGDER